MKGSLAFDPADYDYGPATLAIRRLLADWVDIDWFVLPRADATPLFERHHELARAQAPELFSEDLRTRVVRGRWSEFDGLCGRVRADGAWDWKFGQLKKLSYAHSRARGFALENQPHAPRGERPRPGDLFVRFGPHVMWNLQGIRPKLDGVPLAAAWYRDYAVMDFLKCLEWQLAEGHDRLEGNPFWPLLQVYASGFYPFALSFTEVVLFGLNNTRAEPS